MQENESKRNRAVKRAGDERKQREQKEQEITKLKKQCRERQDEETRLRRDLEEHRRYHEFLAQARKGDGENSTTGVVGVVVVVVVVVFVVGVSWAPVTAVVSSSCPCSWFGRMALNACINSMLHLILRND